MALISDVDGFRTGRLLFSGCRLPMGGVDLEPQNAEHPPLGDGCSRLLGSGYFFGCGGGGGGCGRGGRAPSRNGVPVWAGCGSRPPELSLLIVASLDRIRCGVYVTLSSEKNLPVGADLTSWNDESCSNIVRIVVCVLVAYGVRPRLVVA